MSFADLCQKLHASIRDVTTSLRELPHTINEFDDVMRRCDALMDAEDWGELLKLLNEQIDTLVGIPLQAREQAVAIRGAMFALLDVVDEAMLKHGRE
jgi:hypothetical protein